MRLKIFICLAAFLLLGAVLFAGSGLAQEEGGIKCEASSPEVASQGLPYSVFEYRGGVWYFLHACSPGQICNESGNACVDPDSEPVAPSDPEPQPSACIAGESCTTSLGNPGVCQNVRISETEVIQQCIAIVYECSKSFCFEKGVFADQAVCGICPAGYTKTAGFSTDDCGAQGKACSGCQKVPEPVVPYCGDGKVNQTEEECDDGNFSNTDGCLDNCIKASCGDGYIQSNVEECDDGNLIDSDGCSGSCISELKGDCSDCGKGLFNVCDPDECNSLGQCVPVKGTYPPYLYSCYDGIITNFTAWDTVLNEPAADVNIKADKLGSNLKRFCTTNENGFCSMLLTKGDYNALVYDERFESIQQKIIVPTQGPVQVALNLVNLTCFDSDPENDYYTKGEIMHYTGNKADYCQSGQLYQYHCGGSPVAKTNPVKTNPYQCIAGCQDGVCLNTGPGPSKVTFQLLTEKGGAAPGVKIRIGSGYANCITDMNSTCEIIFDYPDNYTASVLDTFYICGDTTPGCPKSFTPINKDNFITIIVKEIPLKMEVCSDTDHGLNYYSQGAAKDNKSGGAGRIEIDKCLNDGKTIKEAYCSYDKFVGTEKYVCPDGCENSACVGEEPEPIPCSDTDATSTHPDGLNFSKKGTATDVTGSYTDYCSTANNYQEEYYCENDEKVGRTSKRCAEGDCSEGVCLSEAEEPPATPPEPGKPEEPTGKTCSDCGKGILNVCDQDECAALGDCVFNETIVISGVCYEKKPNQIVSKDGGIFETSLFDNNVKIIIPSNAIPDNYKWGWIHAKAYSIFDIDKPSWMKDIPQDAVIIGGVVFDFQMLSENADDITQFNKPVTISITYKSGELDELNENDLYFYFFSTSTESWESLPISLDKNNNSITIQTNHFSGGFTTLNTPKELCAYLKEEFDKLTATVSETFEQKFPYCAPGSNFLTGSASAIILTPPIGSRISGDLETLISRIMEWIFFLALIIAPLIIVIGAFRYMTSAGDPEKTQSAKKIIIYSAIGLAIAIFGRVIIAVIRQILGT